MTRRAIAPVRKEEPQPMQDPGEKKTPKTPRPRTAVVKPERGTPGVRLRIEAHDFGSLPNRYKQVNVEQVTKDWLAGARHFPGLHVSEIEETPPASQEDPEGTKKDVDNVD